MKLFCLLAIFALAVSAAPVEEENGRVNGENGWYVPQSDGSFQWMSLDEGDSMLEELEQEETEGRGISMVPVKYYLYTKSNPTKGTKITDSSKSIAASNFNAAHPTRFLIHGWTQGYKAGMNKEIRDAWLSKGDYNIIVVDWARARSIDYASSVMAVGATGRKVAGMIDYLVKIHGMSLDTVHVIGHSLGAHVAGYAGKNTKSGKVHTIVGLDPALPLFHYKKTSKRLSSTDAVYVESIQTDGGGLGFLKPIGKGAFYPNGGKSQPGCGWDLTGACSHGRSCTYYAESVAQDNFPTMKCSDYKEAVNKDCGASYSAVRMGAMTNAFVVSGNYYVPVHSAAPFGIGFEN